MKNNVMERIPMSNGTLVYSAEDCIVLKGVTCDPKDAVKAYVVSHAAELKGVPFIIFFDDKEALATPESRIFAFCKKASSAFKEAYSRAPGIFSIMGVSRGISHPCDITAHIEV